MLGVELYMLTMPFPVLLVILTLPRLEGSMESPTAAFWHSWRQCVAMNLGTWYDGIDLSVIAQLMYEGQGGSFLGFGHDCRGLMPSVAKRLSDRFPCAVEYLSRSLAYRPL